MAVLCSSCGESYQCGTCGNIPNPLPVDVPPSCDLCSSPAVWTCPHAAHCQEHRKGCSCWEYDKHYSYEKMIKRRDTRIAELEALTPSPFQSSKSKEKVKRRISPGPHGTRIIQIRLSSAPRQTTPVPKNECIRHYFELCCYNSRGESDSIIFSIGAPSRKVAIGILSAGLTRLFNQKDQHQEQEAETSEKVCPSKVNMYSFGPGPWDPEVKSCCLPKGHRECHQSADGGTAWEPEYGSGSCCEASIRVSPNDLKACALGPKHEGLHRSKDGRTSWTEEGVIATDEALYQTYLEEKDQEIQKLRKELDRRCQTNKELHERLSQISNIANRL